MGKFGVMLACLLATTSASHAQWLYQGQESAFGDDVFQIAVTASGRYGFGFRCKGSKIETVYMTPDESFDESTYKVANLTSPKIRIRIDSDPIIDVPVELSDADGKAIAIGDVDLAMLEAVKNAKKRVAVVFQLLNENYHENSFNVRNSTKAIDQIISACQLKAAAE